MRKADTNIEVEKDIAPDATEQKRNFSFLHHNLDRFDEVEDDDGKKFHIPAQVGSTYWAILKVCYMYHDQPLKMSEIVDGAAEILEDRDPDKWDRFRGKTVVKTLKNGEIIEKEAQCWRKRLETNVKTLMRHGGNSTYGLRLIELGHILRQEPDHFKNEMAYVLRTDTNEPIFRGKGRRRKDQSKD